MADRTTTPPPELVKQWWQEAQQADYFDGLPCWLNYVATQAARWGADTELAECCKLAENDKCCGTAFQRRNLVRNLKERRRPKPPSLSEPALQALVHLDKGAESQMDTTEAVYTIRRALERLQELEGNG